MTLNIPSTSSLKLLSSKHAAEILGVKPATLKVWRWRGTGPKYLKLGDKPGSRVMYDIRDLQNWLDARRFDSTAQSTIAQQSDT